MDPLQKKKLNGLLLGSSCLVASAFIGALPALANPTGPHVVSGHDTVSKSGNTTTVDQTSQKGFIDWNSFSIGKGQTVQFVQPGKGSVTVNRVTGGDPSKILGELLANGGVWIINGNGILFGKGSIVNVGSLIATTSDLGDDDFKNGKYRFKKGSNPNASVINQGTITATKGGSVVLSAAHVANEGVIQANLGKVVLGGAAAFTIDLNGDNLIRYQITKSVSQTPTNSNGDARDALVSNSGTIEANGGSVLMTSRAASNVQDNVVNNSGIIEATSVRAHDGEVDLDGGTVKDSGTVDVSGTQAGQTGGDVTITGRKIVVADGAHIDAQGTDGGGTVLIGGGMHGDGKLEQAHKVIIGKAVIDADATSKGNGGKVGIWSKGKTTVNAVIDAEGGRKGGNGGYVETSGRELGMDASALVDTSAAKGIGGTWLLDPTDIIIDNCGANCSVGQVDATVIGSSLSAGTNVTVEAVGTGAGSGNITVESNVTANGAGTLSLLATFDIDVEASIQNAGGGDINLVAGWDGATGITGGSTTGKSNAAVNITAITSTPGAYGENGGSVTIGYADSGTAISVGSAGGTTTVAAQNMYVGVSGCVTANAQLGYMGNGGGDINVVLSGDLTIQSDHGGTSRIGNTGTSGAVTGNITIAADNLALQSYSGNDGQAVIGNAGTGAVSGNIAITTSGDVTMDAGNEFGKYNNTASVGNETTSAAGASGNIKVAVGGGLTMYANYGGTARIGSDSSTTNINVTVASDITMLEGGCEECGGPIHQGSEGSNYSTVQIGNYGGGTSTVGGNISVTSTRGNITLTANSGGYVEIGNAGGLHVSGDVSVAADNGSIALKSYYGYSQIGNEGGGTGGTVTGNITVFAETGLSLYASYSSSHSQIGNYSYAGSGATVSGDIFISAFGGTTINGEGGTTAWIGNIGDTETGDLTLVTGSLTVEQGGDADSATFGNMVASDLTGSVTTATAGTGGSGGGNVTVAIEGSGTTDWGTLFGSGLDFANGNTLSLITEGAMVVSTSITATENGNINLVAGWDGTTGYGSRSIIVSDILSTPSAFGSSGGDITIGGGSENDVAVGTAFGNTTIAGANVNVSPGGPDTVTIGYLGASTGNITIDATANVTIDTPVGGTAQVGNGGQNFNGNSGGNITITAGGNLTLEAIEGSVQIGNGGEGANGNFSGNIDIVADGAIVVEGGGTNGDAGYAQIGNGGSGSNDGTGAGSDSGNITVQGTSVSLDAGSGNGSYVQIGHGGAGSDQASGSGTTGNINVVATDGDVLLQGGSMGDTGEEDNDYAQIGMGGPFSGTDTTNKDSGNITVNASGNISILGGTDADQQNGFAIIGDTGTAEKTGNITVTAGDNITITGGSATGDPDFDGLSNSFALIGDDNAGGITGNVKVTAGGDLALSGGGTGSTGDMAQIGDISSNSDVTGNLNVNVGGTLSFTSTGDPALIADLASGTASGVTLIKTADIDLTSDFFGDLGQSLGFDLDNGNTTLEITDSSADTVIAGAIDADSANTLKILDKGSLHIQSGIQNSGSGAIYVVAGWDGTTTSAGSLTNAGVYGNNDGSITVGDVLGDVAVGSQSGTTTFAAANITLDAAGGYAQIGYHGAGGGNIAVDATDSVTVESGSNDGVTYDAILGNGDFDASGANGNATGNITINAGAGGVTVEAAVGNSVAAIGNVTDDATSGERGNISITTTGTVLVDTPDAGSLAYIGNFSQVATTGGASGNIKINAGALDISNAGDDSESNIGNGGVIGAGSTTVFTNGGAVTGDITITAGNITLTASGNGSYGGQSRISDRGAGTVSGNISVTGTGNMTLQTYAGDVASIGNSEDGTDSTSGNITVTVGGNLSLLAQDTGESRIAAGQTADTNVNVSVTGDILMQVTGDPTTYGGQAIIGNFANGRTAASGNITVTSVDGNITLNTSETYGIVLIGNAIGTTVGGSVKVETANGTLALESAGANSEVEIGETGADSASGGNVIVTAGNLEIDASGTGAVAQIGNGGEEMQGDASGDIAIAVSGNLTLMGGAGFAMIGNGDPFAISNAGAKGTGGATGNISVAVGHTTTITDTGTGTASSTWIGNIADTGEESGSVVFKTKDLEDGGDMPGDFIAFAAADLVGGNVTLEFTDKTGTPTFGGTGDYDSANTLKILSEGSIDLTGSLQNAGDGSIYVVGGWDGSTTSASGLTKSGVYGNNGGSITVGGSTGDASIGSESGNTIFAADNIDVDAANGLAQIGWNGAGGGAVSVVASGNVTVETATGAGCADCVAQIGNGGEDVTGTVTGNISVTTDGGSVLLQAEGGVTNSDESIAEIGNIVANDSSASGDIDIDTNGGALTLHSSGDYSLAQIGDWSTSMFNNNSGTMASNITINAGTVSLDANGAASSAQIGNGNYLLDTNSGAVSGNVTVDASTVSVTEESGGRDESRIGNLGGGVVTGALNVTTTGDIAVSATGNGAASISNFSSNLTFNGQTFAVSQGEASGTVNVKAGGNISVAATGLYGFASIELGGATTGAIKVTANGNISASATDGAGVFVGAAEADNGGASVTVISKLGDINLSSDGSAQNTNGNTTTIVYSSAQIGNAEFADSDTGGNVSGEVAVTATAGNVAVSTGAGSTAQIGNLNTTDTVTGNLTIVAGNAFDIDGSGVMIGNSGPGETGNVSVSAASLSGDISPDINSDLSGGNFTVELSGDKALTLATDIDVDSTHNLSLSNGGDIVFDASVQNSGSGALDVTSTGGNILVGGAGATGNVAVGSRGTSVFSADDITLDAVNGYAQIGYHGNGGGDITLHASGAVTLTGGSSNVAQIGDGATFNTSGAGGNVSILAASLSASGKSDIAGQTADITLSGQGTVGNANHPLEFAVDDLAIQTNGGSVFAMSGQSVSLGVSSDGIDLDGGDFSLAANGSVTQTQAILAGAIDISGSTITLRNAGNAFGAVTLDASGNASIFDTRNLVIANADTGGTLSLSSGGNISQTGGIIAVALNATASHGAIMLTNTDNSFGDATLKASGNASLFDASDLTIASADIGGALSLSGGVNIGQSGAIDAASLNVTASNGAITLTNTGNDFASASLNSSGNATLYDASDLVLTGAGVGQTLSLTSVGNITQTGAITANALDVVADAITLTNAGNSFGSAMLDASGNASLFDASDLTITSAEIGGTFTFSGGGNIDQTGAITADALDVTASNGSIALTNAANTIGSAALTSSGNASLSDASSLTITGANVGGTLTLADGGSIGQTGAIIAKTLDVTASAITLTDSANAISKADLNASGDAALSDAMNLKITGADVGGTVTLKDAHSITQSGAISAKTLHATAMQITLANSANEISNADLSAKNDASLSDASALTITGATVGGVLTLTDIGSIGQTGAITAHTLDATAASMALTDSANAIEKADLSASGNAALSDSVNLKITGADIGGTLTLTDEGIISQSGAITANALDATAKNIVLTNAANSFGSAHVDATNDASLFDASSVVISGADVGGTFTLSSGGDISQSGVLAAGTLDATATQGFIALTNAGNAIGDVSLTSSGDATVYDSISMTLQNASVGGDLTLLTEGSLTFDSSVQLSNGNILAVAGWDGTTTSASGLTGAGAYGNHGGSIIVGGTSASGDVAIGSQTGSTTLAGANVSLEADNGYAQVGYHGGASGALEVLATQAVTLAGGSGVGDYAQIGNGGMDTSGNESGNITVKAGGAVDLDGGTGADAYAQIGHGGADADKDSHGYTNTGTITVEGQTVALVAGAGDQSYTQIGQGGFDLGDGLTGKGENQGDVDVTATDGVTLTGNGADAYAQIGNGGDHVNANAASSASGSNTGSVTVDAGSGTVTITAGVDDSSYVQIGNGGFDVNAGDNPANFSDSGTIMVSDLTLLGSNTGMDGYAQVGNGDASDNGVGDATGNITVSAGTIVLTDGRAKDSPALIGNQTGDGTVTGTITGYTPPPTGDDTNPSAPVLGAIETTIQSQTGEPVVVIIAPPEDFLPPSGDSGTTPQSTGPLAELTGDNGEPPDSTDVATDELGQSLDGGSDAQTVSIIPGVLTEVVYSETPHGIPPANQDFSSWGNEALWRW